MGFGVEVPWANMESDVCKYMDCDAKADADGTLTFTYPIDILDLYPSVRIYLLLITLAYRVASQEERNCDNEAGKIVTIVTMTKFPGVKSYKLNLSIWTP